MTLSKGERRVRRVKRAGIASGVCFIVWIILFYVGVQWAHKHPHLDEQPDYDFIGIACSLSFIATAICLAICLAAAILSCFKSKEPEARTSNTAPDSN